MVIAALRQRGRGVVVTAATLVARGVRGAAPSNGNGGVTVSMQCRPSVAALLSTSSRAAAAEKDGSGGKKGQGAWPSRGKKQQRPRQQQQQQQQQQQRGAQKPSTMTRAGGPPKSKPMPTPEDQMEDIVRNVLQSQQPSDSAAVNKQVAREFRYMKNALEASQRKQQWKGQEADAAESKEPTAQEVAADEGASEAGSAKSMFEPGMSPEEIYASAEGEITPDTRLDMAQTENVSISNSGHRDTDIEELKVISFEHLSRMDIRQHAKELRDRMAAWREPLPEEHLEIETRNYYHVGARGAHIPEARKVTLRAKVSKLGLDAAEREKLQQLVGPRYNRNTGVLTLVARRFPTREMNMQHVKDLITVLIAEAKKPELQLPELQGQA